MHATIRAWAPLICLIYLATLAHAKTNISFALILPFGDVKSQLYEEYLAARDSHAYGVRDAQRLGYLADAHISLIDIDTVAANVGDGVAVFAALDALKQNVSGILGGGSSDASKQISLVTSALQLPFCSFISASSDLSDKSSYPWFFRFVGTSKHMARSMLAFFPKFGWSRLSIIGEGGYAFGLSLAAALTREARDQRYTVLSKTLIHNAETQQDALNALYATLVATDTRVVALLQFTETGPRILHELWRRGWFRPKSPGLPRVLLCTNNPLRGLRAISVQAFDDVLATSAILLPDILAFDDLGIFNAFLAEYRNTTGAAYPHAGVGGFGSGYACGFAMTMGLHRLMQASHASLEDVAGRAPELFANMDLAYFNATAEFHPQLPTPIDKTGDPIQLAYVLRYYAPTNVSGEYVEGTADLLPPIPYEQLTPYAFPGLPLGVYPPDATPRIPLNVSYRTLGGVAALALAGIAGIAIFASGAAVVLLTSSHPVFQRSSRYELGLIHLAGLACIVLGLTFLDIPTPLTCDLRRVLLVWFPALVVLATFPRIVLMRQFLRLRRARAVVRRPALTPAAVARKLLPPSPTTPPSPATAPASPEDAAAVAQQLLGSGSLRSRLASLLSSSSGRLRFPILRRSDVDLERPDAMATSRQHRTKQLMCALEGTDSLALARALAGTALPVLALYAAATAYLTSACPGAVAVVDLGLDASNVACACTSADTNMGMVGAAITAAIHAVALGWTLAKAWAARAVPFNLGEPRRSALCIINLVAATGVLAVLFFASLVPRQYLFVTLLGTYTGASTVAIYTGPMYMRMWSLAAGDVARNVGEDEGLKLASSADELRAAAAAAEQTPSPASPFGNHRAALLVRRAQAAAAAAASGQSVSDMFQTAPTSAIGDNPDDLTSSKPGSRPPPILIPRGGTSTFPGSFSLIADADASESRHAVRVYDAVLSRRLPAHRADWMPPKVALPARDAFALSLAQIAVCVVFNYGGGGGSDAAAASASAGQVAARGGGAAGLLVVRPKANGRAKSTDGDSLTGPFVAFEAYAVRSAKSTLQRLAGSSASADERHCNQPASLVLHGVHGRSWQTLTFATRAARDEFAGLLRRPVLESGMADLKSYI
ncbi:hypothetical protein H9P43_003698 [Blastocladiella emersonii ATCC 22665]|nr:hypothetical protein H9P43_003698 [Blastocladiella emersonii ATCC 22665]